MLGRIPKEISEIKTELAALSARILALEAARVVRPALDVGREALALAERVSREPKPWDVLGISRSLYFQRKKEGKL